MGAVLSYWNNITLENITRFVFLNNPTGFKDIEFKLKILDIHEENIC